MATPYLEAHKFRELVNTLRDTARDYHDKQQLRERLRIELSEYVNIGTTNDLLYGLTKDLLIQLIKDQQKDKAKLTPDDSRRITELFSQQIQAIVETLYEYEQEAIKHMLLANTAQ